MNITALTCTGNRHEAFALCEKWMSRQTIKPHQWIVIDDGDNPVKCTMGQLHVHCLKPSELASLASKVFFVIRGGFIKGDALAFIEDDDWYSPFWIQVVTKELSNARLVGEGNAIYYNVRHRFWYAHNNTNHASLCSTAIGASELESVIDACDESDPFLDQRLWDGFRKKKKVFNQKIGRHVVGIKGMPGRGGYGGGHSLDPSANSDLSLKKLRSMIGEDAVFYEKFINH